MRDSPEGRPAYSSAVKDTHQRVKGLRKGHDLILHIKIQHRERERAREGDDDYGK